MWKRTLQSLYILQAMKEALHQLRPSIASKMDKKLSLPYQTWEALNATVEGMYTLASALFDRGVEFFLPGKLCSDSIEVHLRGECTNLFLRSSSFQIF